MSINIDERQESGDPITGVSYCYASDIATEYRNSITRVTVTMATGKVWIPIYFTPGSAMLSEQDVFTPQGKLVESKFEMKIPGGGEDLMAELSKICGRAVVLKLTYNSGAMVICGGKARKLRLHNLSTQGQQNGNLIGFEYRWPSRFKYHNDLPDTGV